jgi:hypothetical protein
MYESSTEEGSTANYAPDQVLRCEGSPWGKEDTEVSKTIGIRCTHGKTNSCTRSYAAARKDYCALESGQQAAGRPGSARLRQKDAHVQPRPAGKQVKSADWNWGHITTEQPATDPAGPSAFGLWFCFQPQRKLGKENSSIYIRCTCRIGLFNKSFPSFSPFRRFGSSRYRRATLATELGGRSNLPKWIFPISLRFVPSFFFCYASAFHFHLAASGCYYYASD